MNIFKSFLKSIPLPIWIEDMDGKIVFLNKAYEEVYAISFEKVKGKTNEEVLPKEKYTVYNRQMMRCIETSKLERFVETVKGAERECYMFPVKDDDGRVSGVAGIIIDVTDEREQQLELQYQKNILRTIIDSLPEVIFYKDKDCKYVGCNKQFKEYFSRKGINNIMGKTDREICSDKEAAELYIEEDIKVMESKESTYLENSYVDKEGNRRVEESLKVPVINENGEPWGIVGLARNITGRKLLEEKLRYLSYTDNLTGLYNRTYFEEKINELDSEAYLPLGIIMGDVNGLKLINDSFGHLEGDKLLKKISDVLKGVCEDKGFVFRWGGDEFMILVPNCDEKACDGIITRIKKECNDREYEYIKLSIALGGAVKHSIKDDNYKFIKEVEEMVYRQKLLERNSVTSSMLTSLQKSLEAKNMETEEHGERVEKYALKLGELVGLRMSELDELKIVARLHDIGKIAIDEDILLKQGKLTDKEFEIMKTHTEKGYRIINASSMLGNAAKCVLTHHERWDGSGYPLGISEDEIPVISRIVAITDAYDVMTHDRIYKSAISINEAIEELRRCSGTQFDPQLVELFIDNLCGI